MEPSREPHTALVMNSALIRDIAGEALDADGRLKVLPAAFWAATTREERALFGHTYGLYSFPTVELVEHLKEIIGDRKAIEIGAGHGVLAEALDIPATDSYQQRLPKYRAIYELAKQPLVPYGPNVKAYDAKQAVKKYRPDVVIGCWITEKYSKQRPWAGGNEAGIDEGALVDAVDTFVLVGNQKVHCDKLIWNRPHKIEYPPYVFSRAHNGTPDFVAVW